MSMMLRKQSFETPFLTHRKNANNSFFLFNWTVVNKLEFYCTTFSCVCGRAHQKRPQKNGLNAACCTRLNTTGRVCSLEISAYNKNLAIAVGCENGDLYLHQGALTSSNLANDIPWKVVFNLNFRCFSLSKKPINAVKIIRNKLIFCTDTDVLSYIIAENGLDKLTVLDAKNTRVECTTSGLLPSHAEPYFLIGRNDAVYFFNSDGLGPCYGLGPCGVESTKSLALYKNYLVVVAIKYSKPPGQTSSTNLIVLDIHNKLIVLEKSFSDIVGVLCNESQCYFFTNSNELFALQEYSLQTKVQLLLRKGLFDIAIRLFADSQVCGEEILANIYLKYGDHLLSKGNFDVAVDKYNMTLGIVDPYIIIQKLLDSRLNTYLYQYLEALFKSGHAKKQHIKLMLKCNERFDLSTNVETYVNAGSLPQYCLAQLTNKKFKEKSVIDVSYPALVNIIENDSLVLEFFNSMNEEKIYEFFTEHGQLLFKNHSSRIIHILELLCLTSRPISHSPERFIPLLLEYKDLCQQFLGHITDSASNYHSGVYNMFFEILLQSNFFDTNSQQLLKFLDRHAEKMNDIHILLICKIYGFLPGIEMVNEKLPQKNFFNFDLLWRQMYSTFMALSKSEVLDSKQKLVQNDVPQKQICNFLEETKSSNKCPLEILHCILRCKEITVGQINELFNREKYKNLSNREDVTMFCNQARFLNEVLKNYLSRPIEFRSNICNICRQEISHSLPATFYLCQHVFHKDCLHFYSLTDTCTLCSSFNSRTLTGQISSSSQKSEHFEIKNISNMIAACTMRTVFRNYLMCSCSKNSLTLIPSNWVTYVPKNPFEGDGEHYTSNKNPFENENMNLTSVQNPFEEYDSNLNPFNKDV